jgi:alkylhydroperoxidase/carboxymuconolactone decarboxylase family protein YurZ
MAEKEERTQNNRIINAEKYKRRIKKGRIYIDVRDKKLNCLLSKVYTRQQAIECMAKALEENLNGSTFQSLAEAALNALLEGK